MNLIVLDFGNFSGHYYIEYTLGGAFKPSSDLADRKCFFQLASMMRCLTPKWDVSGQDIYNLYLKLYESDLAASQPQSVHMLTLGNTTAFKETYRHLELTIYATRPQEFTTTAESELADQWEREHREQITFFGEPHQAIQEDEYSYNISSYGYLDK